MSLLTQTIDEHILWMAAWSRLALAHGQQRVDAADVLAAPASFTEWKRLAESDLSSQPIIHRLSELYDQMHLTARLVSLKAPEDGPISVGDYETVASKYQEFMIGLRRVERALATANSGLDTLTGLRSRLGMRDDLARELSRSLRSDKPFCVALMDIDHFKKVNDTYGHDNGDRVLSAVANHITRNLRSFDDVWRWGGEEFLLCLKDADLAVGVMALERVRSALAIAPIKLSDGKLISVTASFGVMQTAKDISIDQLLVQVDKALYKAKEGGRNRIEPA